jgi:2-polyprenyl-6-methoxyphenol hydroxylase-like FAD-dependent oxidoreductase
LLVERYPERLGAPKAHALSPRSLEICRQFGLDVVQIRQLGTKREDAFWVNFLTNLSGKAVGQLPYERMDPGVLEETPEVSLFFSLMAESNVQQMIHNIPQPRFEQFLSEYLARDDNVDLRKSVSFVSLVQVSFMILTVPRGD